MNNIAWGIGNISECTGCLACADACKAKAIHAGVDAEGFPVPVHSPEKCVNCGACARVCPADAGNAAKVRAGEAENVFAAVYKDKAVAGNSSSGGAFTYIANSFCQNAEEYSVFGVEFDENMSLKYVELRELSQLGRIRGSKYLQADSEGVFSAVRGRLAGGAKVLFCGTPCCVSALKNFLGNSGLRENLLCVDFVCSGAASPGVFKSFISECEKKFGRKIANLTFRDRSKILGLATSFGSTFLFADGSKKSRKRPNAYMRAFLEHLCLRKSCKACKYATRSRCSDITIGDFWGIDKYVKDMNEGAGVSLVIPNTKKGETLLRDIESFMRVNRLPMSATSKNTPLLKSTAFSANRDIFIRDALGLGFHKAYKLHARHVSFIKRAVAFLTRPLPYNIRNAIIKRF